MQRGHGSIPHLNSQVATGNHQAVGRIEDFLQRSHCFNPFDLGDGQGMAACGQHQLTRHIHVRGALGEGNCQEVGTNQRRRLDVIHVLGGQRRRGKPPSLPIDPLVIRKIATMAHNSMDFAADNARHLKDDTTIIKQQDVAVLDVFRQIFVVQADTLLITEFALGIKDEMVAIFQGDPAMFKFSDPNLGALQIRQNPDRTSDPRRNFTHAVRQCNMVFGFAVRKIQTKHINTGADQGLKRLRVIGSGAKGGNYLRMAGHGTPFSLFVFG